LTRKSNYKVNENNNRLKNRQTRDQWTATFHWNRRYE